MTVGTPTNSVCRSLLENLSLSPAIHGDSVISHRPLRKQAADALGVGPGEFKTTLPGTVYYIRNQQGGGLQNWVSPTELLQTRFLLETWKDQILKEPGATRRKPGWEHRNAWSTWHKPFKCRRRFTTLKVLQNLRTERHHEKYWLCYGLNNRQLYLMKVLTDIQVTSNPPHSCSLCSTCRILRLPGICIEIVIAIIFIRTKNLSLLTTSYWSKLKNYLSKCRQTSKHT